MKPFLVASSAKVASTCAMSAAECDVLNVESIALIAPDAAAAVGGAVNQQRARREGHHSLLELEGGGSHGSDAAELGRRDGRTPEHLRITGLIEAAEVTGRLHLLEGAQDRVVAQQNVDHGHLAGQRSLALEYHVAQEEPHVLRDYPRHVPLVHAAAQQVQHGINARLPGTDHDVVVGLRRRQRVDGLDRCVPSFGWKRRWAHRRHHHARLRRDQLAIAYSAPPAAGVDEGGRLRVVGGHWEEAHAARRDKLGHHAIVVLEHLRAGGQVVGVQDLTPVLHLAQRLGGDAVRARWLVQRHEWVSYVPVAASSGLLVDDHEGGLVCGAEHRVDKRHGGGAW
eukprot:scaffold27751_cov71-Phaeocystis_antarctica.AAC.1